MLRLTRFSILIAIFSYCGSALIVRSQTSEASKSGGVVAGKVTIKGKPAPDIVVTLHLPERPMTVERILTARTDQEGNYLISQVPPGTYSVSPAAPAYVINAKNKGMTAQTAVVTGNEIIDGINFDLVRGGVITGKVTDTDGQPVIELPVTIYDSASESGEPFSMGNRNFRTDDRGVYRLFGLPAGRYKLAVGYGEIGYNPTLGRNSYKQTFYPDPSDPSKPGVIEVSEGSEASDIDIKIRSVKTYSVSGRVIDGETGKPLEQIRLAIQSNPQRPRGYYLPPALSNRAGEFTLEGLAPGRYGIFIAPNGVHQSDILQIVISDHDIKDLVIKTSNSGASVSGVVVLENTDDKSLWARLLQLRVFGYVQKSEPSNRTLPSSTLGPDGSFTLHWIEPGALYISLGGNLYLSKGFIVARLETDGNPPGPNIEIKGSERITGVRVVVAYGTATIHGVVKLASGPLPEGTQVYVRIIKDGITFRSPRVDRRGNFIVEGIPPGLYNFDLNLFNPDSTKRFRPYNRQQVNVLDGIVNEVTLVIADPEPR